MEFRKFRAEDIAQAARLLANRHARERRAFPALKAAYEDEAHAERILRNMYDNEYVIGLCAYENSALKGYILSDIREEPALGRRAFVRYEGMAVADGESAELFRAMYAHISQTWLAHGALSHYAMVPAGETAVVEAWLKLCFSYQQVYGIAELRRRAARDINGVRVRQADKRDGEALKDISSLIFSHQAGAPTYAPVPPERMLDIREGYGELPEDAERVTLLALAGEELLEFVCAETGADDENMYVPENSAEISICGIVERARGKGIGGMLARHMQNRLIDDGFTNVITDWRIANLNSSNFWPKQGFAPIAYRMFRRIDERVYWANGKAGI